MSLTAFGASFGSSTTPDTRHQRDARPAATRPRGFRGVETLLDGLLLLEVDRAALLEWARWEVEVSKGAEPLAAALLLVRHRAAQVAALRAVPADR